MKMRVDVFLAKFRLIDYMEITKDAESIKGLDTNLMLHTVDYIKVYESGVAVTAFLDGTEIE